MSVRISVAGQKHPILGCISLSHALIKFNNPDSSIPPQYFPSLRTRERAIETSMTTFEGKGGHVARDGVALVENKVWTNDAWKYIVLCFLA